MCNITHRTNKKLIESNNASHIVKREYIGFLVKFYLYKQKKHSTY